MDFHIFVLISTIIYYIVLRMYKYRIQQNTLNKNKKSNFIYVLFLPCVLYLSKYIFSLNYDNKENANIIVDRSLTSSNNSNSILSMPYPDSSITF